MTYKNNKQYYPLHTIPTHIPYICPIFGTKYYDPSHLLMPSYPQFLYLSLSDLAQKFGETDAATYAQTALPLLNTGHFDNDMGINL